MKTLSRFLTQLFYMQIVVIYYLILICVHWRYHCIVIIGNFFYLWREPFLKARRHLEIKGKELGTLEWNYTIHRENSQRRIGSGRETADSQCGCGVQDTFYWPVCHLCRVSGAIVSSSDHVNLDIYNLCVLMTINPSSADILVSPGGCGQCLCHRCPHIYLTHRQCGGGAEDVFIDSVVRGGGGKHYQRHGQS